jgi:hypothetical protein
MRTVTTARGAAQLAALALLAASGCATPAAGPGGTSGAAGSSAAGNGAAGSGAGPGSGGAGTTGAGGVGGAAGAMPPIDGCNGVALTQTGVLDLDLHSVALSGAITLNGAPLPDATASRGALTFVSSDGRTTANVSLGTTGAASYALRLPPARYDVNFTPNAAACTATQTSATPCNGGTLRAGVSVTTDGALDIDISAVTISGAVTLAGAALPTASMSRGAISFAGADGGAPASTPLGSSGAVSYRVTLLRGSYDVRFTGNGAACAATPAPAVPCNDGRLRAALPLTATGVLDLDVPVAHVSGAVTLDGAALPTESAARGALSFAGATGETVGVATTASLGTGGPASYALALFPGHYDVSFAANAAFCAAASATVPCVGGKLKTAVGLTADGGLDLDLHAVTITGAVTVAGAAMPTAASDRGTVLFTNVTGGSGSPPSFGASGAASYRMRVLAGTYDVGYVANAALCATKGGAAPPVPCNGGTLMHAAALTGDGALDLDLPIATISGAVTLAGAPLPAATADRGALAFVSRDGAGTVTTPTFGTSGAVAYALALWPGSYDVAFAADAALCKAAAAPPAIPCVGGVVASAVMVRGAGVLDVDVPTVSLSGAVNLDGAALPTATADRGSISFARVTGEGGGAAGLSLGTSAAANYAITIVPGHYVVSHVANAALCGGATLPAVPCASQVLLGCP